MTELESLFLVVLLVYLLQCVYWVSPGSDVFALDFRGRGKRKIRGFAWQALKTEGFLASPLPPLSPLAVAAWPSFELSSDGISFRQEQGQWTFLPWDRLSLARSETRLRCNGTTVLHAGEYQVRQCFALVERLQLTEKRARGRLIQQWLGKAMGPHTAYRRARVFAGRSRLLRVLANMQLVFLFVAVPVAFAWLGPRVLTRVVLFLVASQILIALEFWIAHKRLFRKSKSARFKSTLTIVLSPVAAIRSCDVLARDVLSGCHPLAVACALLSTEDFSRFAGEQLRELRFSDHPDGWYQDMAGSLMDRLIREAGLHPDSLLRPSQREGGCVAYCPRCLAQYNKARGTCADCGFLGLVPFEMVNHAKGLEKGN